MNIFNKLFKRTITVKLDSNVSLTLVPTVGGVNAELTTTGERFMRTERAFFSSCGELVNSLRLTDNVIVRKLAKAF